jgi:hypothetical protein
MKTPHFFAGVLAAALALAGTTAQAHDTWFEALSGAANPGGLHLLALGTGNQVPKQESAVAASVLVRQACVDAGGRSRALQPQLQLPTRLLLRTTVAGAMTCWAQLMPFDIELPADKVAVYFDEIRPSPAVLAAWAALQARGLPWRERYTKYARIELPGAGPAAQPPALPMGLDLQLLANTSQLQAGNTVAFQLWRDGQALAGQWLELRGAEDEPSLWAQTDSAGQLRLTLPKAGAWVLRGTELRLASDDPTRWDSRFITLALQVQPAP